jgi:hypothetical protein
MASPPILDRLGHFFSNPQKILPEVSFISEEFKWGWNIFIIALLITFIIIYFIIATTYRLGCKLYRSDPDSINKLLSIRRADLGNSVDILKHNDTSVCANINNNVSPYTPPTAQKPSGIPTNQLALLNWRPMTVRLAGYLGGICSATDGVFDMAKGIQCALSLGARAFVFDIDYLNKSPCTPLVIHRDSGGVMRSLNTGSIADGMRALTKMAFTVNTDPVLIILYIRRVPEGLTQKDNYFKAIATALDPISPVHLGLTEQGNFHSCGSESTLFTSNINNYQKKFIVLCNYDTTLLPQKSNPKDNLNFWVNARLWKHELSPSLINSVTPTITGSVVPYAKIGSTSDFLTIPGSSSSATTNFVSDTSIKFTIALGPVEESLPVNKLNILLNNLGIHCVPMDVVRLGENPAHSKTISNKKPPAQLSVKPDLTDATNQSDPLSFWTYAGWSRFNSL